MDCQVMPSKVSWLLRCMEEFFKQGDKEQEQGLDFSPLCDRQNTMVPQSQIGKWGRIAIVSSRTNPLEL